jgi:hypothetical protein
MHLNRSHELCNLRVTFVTFSVDKRHDRNQLASFPNDLQQTILHHLDQKNNSKGNFDKEFTLSYIVKIQ